jgi:hypothetical protein
MTIYIICGVVAVHRGVAEEIVPDARTKFERVARHLKMRPLLPPHIYSFCNDSAFIGSICRTMAL